jgi:hypothetical protein
MKREFIFWKEYFDEFFKTLKVLVGTIFTLFVLKFMKEEK